MEISIQEKKIELIQWLTTLNDKVLIQRLIEFRNNPTSDWWSEISNNEKESIERGLSDADSGNLNSHLEARKVYEKWL